MSIAPRVLHGTYNLDISASFCCARNMSSFTASWTSTSYHFEIQVGLQRAYTLIVHKPIRLVCASCLTVSSSISFFTELGADQRPSMVCYALLFFFVVPPETSRQLLNFVAGAEQTYGGFDVEAET